MAKPTFHTKTAQISQFVQFFSLSLDFLAVKISIPLDFLAVKILIPLDFLAVKISIPLDFLAVKYQKMPDFLAVYQFFTTFTGCDNAYLLTYNDDRDVTTSGGYKIKIRPVWMWILK